MNRKLKLDKIKEEIERCKICQVNKIGLAVVGEGDKQAEKELVGEAPGKTEAKTGKPFVGRSGKLLRKLIRETGLLEERV